MTKKVREERIGYDTSRLQEALGACTDYDTLRCLYTEYSERLRNRGAHIWTTGAVFIPLSISGVIVAEKQTAWSLAIGSSLLILIWFFISEQMRIELERHRFICAELETAMLKHELSLTKYGLAGLLVSSGQGQVERILQAFTLRRIRLTVTCLVTIGWFVLAGYWTVT